MFYVDSIVNQGFTLFGGLLYPLSSSAAATPTDPSAAVPRLLCHRPCCGNVTSILLIRFLNFFYKSVQSFLLHYKTKKKNY